MKLPDIHDFSTTSLYQQATQILHSLQTFSIEEEAPNEFAGLFQTEKELLQIRLQLDDDLTIQSVQMLPLFRKQLSSPLERVAIFLCLFQWTGNA